MPYKETYDGIVTLPVDLYAEYKYNQNSECIDSCRVTVGESDVDVWESLTDELQGAVTEAIAEDYARRDM